MNEYFFLACLHKESIFVDLYNEKKKEKLMKDYYPVKKFVGILVAFFFVFLLMG